MGGEQAAAPCGPGTMTRGELREAIQRQLTLIGCHGITAAQAVEGVLAAAEQYAAGQYARDLLAQRSPARGVR